MKKLTAKKTYTCGSTETVTVSATEKEKYIKLDYEFLEDMFTFESQEEADQAWMERFGD